MRSYCPKAVPGGSLLPAPGVRYIEFMFRIPAIALLTLFLLGCPGPEMPAGGIEAAPHALDNQAPERTELGEAQVLGILELKGGHRWFGGLSGMSMDGDWIIAVNDSGHWVRFRLHSDADGKPLAVSDLHVAPLGGLDGSKHDGDAEELVAISDGWLVSFERRHRVLRYGPDLSGEPVSLDIPAAIAGLPDNGGIESLALLADGRLFMVAEEGERDGLLPAWIGHPGAWEALSYQFRIPYRPTGMAALPGGGALAVERRFSVLGGLGARLVHIAPEDLQPGAIIRPREIFSLGSPLLVDNYEAVAVRRRADGRMIATLLSDDNFNPLQSTLLMVVLLPEDF